MSAWDQALWLYVMLSSGFVAFFGSAPAEPFFRPDPALTRLPRAVAVKDGRFLRPPEGLCFGHVRQSWGESPLCNLMEVKH